MEHPKTTPTIGEIATLGMTNHPAITIGIARNSTNLLTILVTDSIVPLVAIATRPTAIVRTITDMTRKRLTTTRTHAAVQPTITYPTPATRTSRINGDELPWTNQQ